MSSRCCYLDETVNGMSGVVWRWGLSYDLFLNPFYISGLVIGMETRGEQARKCHYLFLIPLYLNWCKSGHSRKDILYSSGQNLLANRIPSCHDRSHEAIYLNATHILMWDQHTARHELGMAKNTRFEVRLTDLVKYANRVPKWKAERKNWYSSTCHQAKQVSMLTTVLKRSRRNKSVVSLTQS